MKEAHPLTSWRDERGISQDDFASDLDVTRWTVTSIETGRRRPSVELTAKIEAITGISRAALRPDIFGPSEAAA
jgi:DNA-binding XRE family transcriptional regulator